MWLFDFSYVIYNLDHMKCLNFTQSNYPISIKSNLEFVIMVYHERSYHFIEWKIYSAVQKLEAFHIVGLIWIT